MPTDFIETLRKQLTQPLPGREAQYRMAGLRRIQELGPASAPPPDARVACVLMLLHQPTQQPDWHTVLIRRTSHPRDRHAGQISFPGGRWEEVDGDELAAVALREAHEEIGVSPLEVDLLGRLTELYIPVSNFVVHPFVGHLLGRSEFILQPTEVEEVLTPPLILFTQPDSRRLTDLNLGQERGVLRDVPYFTVEGHRVWGATAMIISEFLAVISSFQSASPR